MAHALDIIERIKPRDEWPLKRKLAWLAAYCAIFVWAGLMILLQGW